MNFYEATYGKKSDVAVMDKNVSDTGNRIYVVTCKDREGQLLKLLQTIRKTGNCGHSFDIVVDPDTKSKETIFWDGDGSDRIDTITSHNAELDLTKVLLANIETIKRICNGAIPSDDDAPGELDDPIEALKKIKTSCDALLDGNGLDFGNGIKNALEVLMENTKKYIKESEPFPAREGWSPKDGFEHLLFCMKNDYERMVDSLKKDEIGVDRMAKETKDGVRV